jgi:phosphoenolpyruvate carboxykinase (ATP)
MSSELKLQEAHGITVSTVLRNPAPATLYEHGVLHDGAAVSASGALISMSGAKTGRSPNDKRVVAEPGSEQDVWWGGVNIKLSDETFVANRQTAVDFLNKRERIYVIDGFAGWAPEHRLKVRIICARPYHALFMHNMLIRPTADELATFGEPDYVIINAGEADADTSLEGNKSKCSVALHFGRREFVILGTQYAGEMKKGVFTIMHYLMPKRGVLSMHCSANEGASAEDVSLFFGLSGTGKTTLSADPGRHLIGDDEHCWTPQGVFNIEGGCYAKTIDLSAEKEPEIYAAIRFGSVLENVVYDETTREVDWTDASLTQNTRTSYPIEYIPNAKIPCVAGHPKNIIFLTADAFGVLPPVSKLTPEQASYHFISGYTAKVAGTEVGVTEPQATFSACFGAAFLVWHPQKYGAMLADLMRQHGAKAWLVNTGWTGGSYGVGHRISLKHTRAIIDAIHSGALNDAPTVRDSFFDLEIPSACPGVPESVLLPWEAWSSRETYDKTATKLVGLFERNYEQFKPGASMNAGPVEG